MSYSSKAIRISEAIIVTRVHTFSVMGTPIATPAGETCLKLAAAGKPSAIFNSLTSGQALSESRNRFLSQRCRFERDFKE